MIELLLAVPTVFSSMLWTYFWFWFATNSIVYLTSLGTFALVLFIFFYFLKWVNK